MLTPPEKLSIAVSKTSDGQYDYLQILSVDQFSVNIVLIAGQIEIRDARPPASANANTSKYAARPTRRTTGEKP